MFETAELGHHLSKTEYRKIEPELRAQLLQAQYDLSENGKFPVIMLISGVRGAGKGETVNLLHEWMDPRHIDTHAFDNPTDEELARPRDVALLARAAAEGPHRHPVRVVVHRAHHRSRVRPHHGGRARARIDEIDHFERMLADEGALILKFWFHLGKQAAAQAAEGDRGRPEDALAHHSARLGLLQEIRPLLPRQRGHAHADLDRLGALDRGRGRGPRLSLGHGGPDAPPGDAQAARREARGDITAGQSRPRRSQSRWTTSTFSTPSI